MNTKMMLQVNPMNDGERKLYRILYNYFTIHRSMPSWNELMAKTGKTKDSLFIMLEALETHGAITWSSDDNLQSIKLLQLPYASKPKTRSGSEYFTDY